VAENLLGLSLTGPQPILEAEPTRPAKRGGDPALAEAILSGDWNLERDLVVLVGPGAGPPSAALRRLGQQRILWFRTCDDGSADAPIGVIRVDHVDEVAAAVRALGALAPDRIDGRALDPVHARLCDQVIARIEGARARRSLGGGPGAGTLAHARIEQGLANLPALCRWPGAGSLAAAMNGTPLVIVAPGPSLDRHIDTLRELRGRAVLLALSHSVAPLRRAGITPDIVLVADSHDVSHHLAGADLSDVHAVVVASTAHPTMFRTAAPRYLALPEPCPIDDWLWQLAGADQPDPLAIVQDGGSVAHTALALGLAWGCDPIGFVGLDLSFPGGRCYVENSADGDVRAVASHDGRAISLEGWREPGHRGRSPASERLVELPGWDGRPLPSSFHFSMCQRWFEETARQIAGRVRLYNCSEGGAYIGGMRHIRLAWLASQLPPANGLDLTAAAARAVDQVDARSRRRVARERLVELMLDLRSTAALSGAALCAVLGGLPILSTLVETELGPATGTASDAERRSAALHRGAAWLEPRVIEAERALAREDRSAVTQRLWPQTAGAALPAGVAALPAGTASR
jgi:hypothetical protein